jgi:hypothetical protein
VPLARGGISALMALIIRLEADRDDQNLSYAATFRQGSRVDSSLKCWGRRKDGTLDEVPDEKRLQDSLLAPLRVQLFLICSGGFRFAATSGYYLPALWADAHQHL